MQARNWSCHWVDVVEDCVVAVAAAAAAEAGA